MAALYITNTTGNEHGLPMCLCAAAHHDPASLSICPVRLQL